MKSLGAKGYEYTSTRDEFNQYSESDLPNQVNYDISDQVILAGAKYDFGPNSFIGLTAQWTSFVDNSISTLKEDAYDLDQIYIVYQIKF